MPFLVAPLGCHRVVRSSQSIEFLCLIQLNSSRHILDGALGFQHEFVFITAILRKTAAAAFGTLLCNSGGQSLPTFQSTKSPVIG